MHIKTKVFKSFLRDVKIDTAINNDGLENNIHA